MMADKREAPDEPVASDDIHPTEPAEGAREPGADAAEPRPPHPEKPAEGDR